MGFINSCFKLLICCDFAKLLTNADKNIGSLYRQMRETGAPEQSSGPVLWMNRPASSLAMSWWAQDTCATIPTTPPFSFFFFCYYYVAEGKPLLSSSSPPALASQPEYRGKSAPVTWVRVSAASRAVTLQLQPPDVPLTRTHLQVFSAVLFLEFMLLSVLGKPPTAVTRILN